MDIEIAINTDVITILFGSVTDGSGGMGETHTYERCDVYFNSTCSLRGDLCEKD